MGERTVATRYTDEQRELAFQVWTFRANRNAAEATRLLAEMGDEGFTVSRQMVAQWAREQGWDRRADQDLFAGAPRLRFGTQTELILAAPEAAAFLRKVIALDPSLMTEAVVDAWEDGERVKKVVRLVDEKIVKLRIQAAQVVLDRTGFSPVGTRDVGSVDAPPEVDGMKSGDIKAIEDHGELAKAEAKIRAEFGMGRRG